MTTSLATRALEYAVNAQRRLENIYGQFFQGSATQTKHNYAIDFGYPEYVTPALARAMYARNGIAGAGIDKTVGKCWETPLVFAETPDPELTPLEEDIKSWAHKRQIMQSLMIADRRAMVQGYSFVILRLRDNKTLDKPATTVAGLDAMIGVIPVWRDQMRATAWDTDMMSDTYGLPTMYEFDEYDGTTSDPNMQSPKSIKVHASRVLIWSADGTLDNDSALTRGYNDLVDLEKIKGAGGEGFWKNAKSAPVIEVDKDAKLKDMADAMGVTPDKLADAMDEQVDEYSKGFDSMLMIQGMKAKSLNVSLPSPQHFFAASLMAFASSMLIPAKILVGSQTGERASTEDANEWNQTCMSRRTNEVEPNLYRFMAMLVRLKVFNAKVTLLYWPSLTEASTSEKLEKAAMMAEVNSKLAATRELAFTIDEIREAADYTAATERELFDDTSEI